MMTKNSQESVEKAFKVGKDTVEQAVKASTQVLQKNFEQTIETTKKRVEEITKSYGDYTAFGKENVEAIVASGAAATKGFEALNEEIVGLSKKAYEANVAAMKSLASAKTPQEFFEIQNNLFKDAYQDLVSKSSKIGELGKTVATEAFEPINARMTVAAEAMKKQFAL
jgi:phasin family protein